MCAQQWRSAASSQTRRLNGLTQLELTLCAYCSAASASARLSCTTRCASCMSVSSSAPLFGGKPFPSTPVLGWSPDELVSAYLLLLLLWALLLCLPLAALLAVDASAAVLGSCVLVLLAAAAASWPPVWLGGPGSAKCAEKTSWAVLCAATKADTSCSFEATCMCSNTWSGRKCNGRSTPSDQIPVCTLRVPTSGCKLHMCTQHPLQGNKHSKSEQGRCMPSLAPTVPHLSL
jgi:hypothetical protein